MKGITSWCCLLVVCLLSLPMFGQIVPPVGYVFTSTSCCSQQIQLSQWELNGMGTGSLNLLDTYAIAFSGSGGATTWGKTVPALASVTSQTGDWCLLVAEENNNLGFVGYVASYKINKSNGNPTLVSRFKAFSTDFADYAPMIAAVSGTSYAFMAQNQSVSAKISEVKVLEAKGGCVLFASSSLQVSSFGHPMQITGFAAGQDGNNQFAIISDIVEQKEYLVYNNGGLTPELLDVYQEANNAPYLTPTGATYDESNGFFVNGTTQNDHLQIRNLVPTIDGWAIGSQVTTISVSGNPDILNGNIFTNNTHSLLFAGWDAGGGGVLGQITMLGNGTLDNVVNYSTSPRGSYVGFMAGDSASLLVVEHGGTSFNNVGVGVFSQTSLTNDTGSPYTGPVGIPEGIAVFPPR
jgi:hypothetical protein